MDFLLERKKHDLINFVNTADENDLYELFDVLDEHDIMFQREED